MKRCFNGWRSIVCMAAVGAVAFSVIAYGAPKVKPSDMSPKEGLVTVDLNTPVMTHLDDATMQRGGVAGVPVIGAPVYLQVDTCGRGHFWNNDYTYGYGAWWGQARFDCPPGFPLCDSRGWVAGDQIAGYEVSHFFCSSSSANDCAVSVELWDGDPMWVYDTYCTGTPAPIAGTKVTFTGLTRGYRHNLRVQLPAPVTYNCDRVWISVSMHEGCRGSWLLGGQPPAACYLDPADIGWGDGYGAVFGCQNSTGGCGTPSWYNAGFCCTGVGACDYTGWCDIGGTDTCDGGPNTGAACTSQADCWTGDCQEGGTWPPTCPADCWGYFTHPTFCSDGFADLYFYGGGYTQYGYYYAQPGAVYAATDITMSWIPVSAGAPPTATAGVAYTIVGNEIKLESGGLPVWMEVRISDVDPLNSPNVQQIKAWQTNLTTDGFTAGLQGTLTVYAPACTTDADCEALMGPLGHFSCGGKGGCGALGWPAGSCIPCWIDNERTDYILYGTAESAAVDVSTPQYRPASTAPAFTSPDYETYGATLTLTVPADAKGTFYTGIDPLPSGVSDGANVPLPMFGFVPGVITVVVGKCCYDIGGASPGCVDGLKADECGLMPGTTKFYPDEVCTGDLAADCPACTKDSDCDDSDGCTDDDCDEATGICYNDDNFDTVNECCTVATGVTCDRVDADQCTDDVCELANSRGACLHPSYPTTPTPTACDDENPCTYDDECDGLTPPSCVGLDVNAVPCTTSTDCETVTGVAFDCIGGYCFCTIAPTLTPVVIPSAKPNPNCYLPGEKIMVDIFVGAAAGVINGAQFVLEYDPACVSFNDIMPGNGLIGNPYPFEIEEVVDEANGKIFYAVGVNPFFPTGTNGNAVLARVSFTKVGVCTDCVLCFGGENPMNTYLVDDAGQPIFVEPECSKPIIENDVITLDCPGNEVSNVDCDKNTAEVYWDAPTASSSCYDVDLVCFGQHESGMDMTDYAMGGGEHPLGVTTYDCIATSTVCGDSETCRWTVTVNDATTLDVEIQISPIIAGDLLRCIKFELFSDCTTPPLVFNHDIFFGGLFDHIGHFTNVIKIPDAGQWKCITARDQLHTLRSCAWLECVDGVYYAIFKGDPFFGGNWLVGGNLDGFKKENPYASHDVIDILDFGMFVSQYLRIVDPNTPCITQGPHADINGDGIVDALDFSFVMRNFLTSSKDCCCGPAAGTTVGRTEISVRELREMGLGDLAVGDVNRDGLLNMDDVNAFQAGDLHKKPRERMGLK